MGYLPCLALQMALDAPNHDTNDVAGGKQIKSGSTGKRTANACMMVSTSNLGEIETAMCKCTKFDKSSSQSYRLFLGLLREQPPPGHPCTIFSYSPCSRCGPRGFFAKQEGVFTAYFERVAVLFIFLGIVQTALKSNASHPVCSTLDASLLWGGMRRCAVQGCRGSTYQCIPSSVLSLMTV